MTDFNTKELEDQIKRQVKDASSVADSLFKFEPIGFNLEDIQAQIKKQIEVASNIPELNIENVIKNARQSVDKGLENLSNSFKSIFDGLSVAAKNFKVPDNSFIKIDTLKDEAVNKIKTASEKISSGIEIIKNTLKQNN